MDSSKRDLAKLQTEHFDVLIIGGGISGAWLALHCAQQGHKTALIEKHDYASQTSSSSSKLLHGGIRYLQQMQFGKVRESAIERAHYVYAAPHLSTPVPFAVPTYRDFQRSKYFLNCGMLAYRFLCFGENRLIDSAEQTLPPIRSISAPQLNQICDLSNEDHTGAVVFYERHMSDSERMVLAILKTAQQLGAQIHNYVGAENFIVEGNKVTGAQARDELGKEIFEIKSKLVINAAGPWIDNLNKDLAAAQNAPSINGFAVGSHIITRQLADHAIAITTKHQSDAKIDRGGRHVFIIPWRGYSLIGTSYNDIESPNNDIKLESDHVKQLLEAINQGFPSAKLCRQDLVSGYSGLYILNTDNIQNTVYQGSGEYQVIDHAAANSVDGLITALGAKFTTGRKLSALTMKLVAKKLGTPYAIEKVRLQASQYSSFADFSTQAQQRYAKRFSKRTIQHLLQVYGSQLDDFVASLSRPELEAQIFAGQPDLLGQVHWAVINEQALRLDDVLFNRTSLGLLGITDEAIVKIAKQMAIDLSWSEDFTEQEIELVLKKIKDTKRALLGS
ncbi:MAG: glycerol-3-phosphate dehydrogenase [Cryomorphaceae bacterium]|jgi:glycerol-3-phosphate dehydrogenase